ncbi:MAG: hypothetical protein ISR83_01340 [Candidatus Marinimicrobia bacterium]|nr:hypothetical protein [Candidatus Neomarinimicrobiota bacterium]
MDPSVFHIRLRHFELQAERMMDPSLRTRPIAVLSSQNQNGTIVSLSSEAEEEGLYAGMKVSIARHMSHGVQMLPYNQSLYQRLNQYVYQTVSSFTPVVEPEGYGRYYLDMNGMKSVYQNFQNTGLTIVRHITEKTRLTGVVGISPNKLISQISTSVIPESIHEVNYGDEANFLSPLHAPVLPSVQEVSVKKMLHFLFIQQIGHIQDMIQFPDVFRNLFGLNAVRLSMEARGKDTSVVSPPLLRNHILEQTVVPNDTNDENTLQALVKNLAEQIAFKLRQRNEIAKKVKLEVHYADGLQSARAGALKAIDDISVIRQCQRLFEKANSRRNRIRSLLLDASSFSPYSEQACLFQTQESRNMALSRAIETVRKKYGVSSLQTANVFHAMAQV